MSVRVEVVVRVTTLDGTALAESIRGVISAYGGDEVSEEFRLAGERAEFFVQEASREIKAQLAAHGDSE